MADELFNLTPEGLRRIEKRKTYEKDESHHSLKDYREKRDQLKTKKTQDESPP